MKKIYSFLFLFFIFLFAHAQDLTGIWRGHFSSSNSFGRQKGMDDRYKIEVQIAQRGNSFQAVTYSYLTTVFYGKADADGTFNPVSKKALLRELKLVDVRMTYPGDVNSMTYFLRYSKLGGEEYLQGTYTSMNIKDSSKGAGGTVFLRKVTESDFSKEPFVEKREKEIEREKSKVTASPKPPATKPKTESKKPAIAKKPTTAPPTAKKKNSIKKSAPISKNTSPKKNKVKPTPTTAPPIAKLDLSQKQIEPVKPDSILKPHKKWPSLLITPEVLSNRKNELEKTITVNTNELELRIYDDGAIDHDTVSVFVDKKMVISHAMLTDRPIILKLHMDVDDDYHEVVMVAENEGEIPPNTSLMIVKAGDKEYEVRIVSTEQKNAIVVFKYEKPK
ncbi:MAG: hypothetical protein JST58_13740 [Bacteroidetes bacterium]|nr:hypothetical protein [Bacteroidota bacterium]